MRAGNNGITSNTVQNIAFGAGTIHKGLKMENDKWNFESSCIGATKGGSSVKIIPSFYSVQPDGSTVSIKAFKRKTGETATMEINMIELTPDIVKSAIVGKTSPIGVFGDASIANCDIIVSKEKIDVGDYWENIAFVGETLEGKNIIVILPDALCTSGLTIEGKNGEESVGKFTFECHSDVDSSLTTLPYEIYYPKKTS